MKVLHIINSMGSGGAEKLLSDYLIKSKDDADITHSLYILTAQNNRFLDRLIDNSVNLKISNRSNLYNPLHLIDLFTLIKTETPNIVHVHLFPAFYFVGLVSFLLPDTKFIFTEHSTNNRRRNKFFLKPLEHFIYGRYHQIIAVSKSVKNSLAQWIGLKEKIAVIHNGVDLDRFINASKIDLRSEYNLPKDSILLVMVARFSPAKDHETLIRTMAILPDNYYLFLAGEGSTKNSMEELSKELNISNKIIFLGFKNDIPEIIKSCNIAILSTHYEGLPIAAIEAIATGTPLIYSSVPGLEGEFRNVAFELPSNSTYDLHKAILNVTNNLSDSKKLSNMNKYSLDTYKNHIESAYVTLIRS